MGTMMAPAARLYFLPPISATYKPVIPNESAQSGTVFHRALRDEPLLRFSAALNPKPARLPETVN